MSYMDYCYHIAITSGDNATTRSGSFDVSPLPPSIKIASRDAAYAHHRDRRIRKFHIRLLLTTG